PNSTAPPSRGNAPASPITRYTESQLTERFEAKTFQDIHYRFFEPDNPDGEKLPLLLSLHGAGGKGTDNVKNLKIWNGVITEPEFQAKHPCYIVVPQSVGPWRVAGSEPNVTDDMIETFPEIWQRIISGRKAWLEANPKGNLQTVFALLDSLGQDLPVDLDRVYVLGHSMGGFGSFEAIAQAPNRFAAAIPSAGGLAAWHDPQTFAHVPIWAFHGDQDTTVPFALSQLVFDQLALAEGNMKLTRLGGVRHGAAIYAFVYSGDAMHETFHTSATHAECDLTEDVWTWLFRQSR
ncbi:MAG: alpha/beta fold hydrolase, partial [Verrucomicrobiota bacterium]